MATRVRQYTMTGLFVGEFKTIKEAAEKSKCPERQISRCVNSDSLSAYGAIFGQPVGVTAGPMVYRCLSSRLQ